MANGTENSIRTSLYIPPELLAQVRAEAELSGRSLNGQLLAMVRACLETQSSAKGTSSELRTRIALSALTGLLSGQLGPNLPVYRAAELANAYADAMLASLEAHDA